MMTEIESAMKKVKAETKVEKENLMLIKLAWDRNIVVPYEAGLRLMAAMEHAELYTDEYNKAPRITPIPKSVFEFSIFNRKDYQFIKASALLKLDKPTHDQMYKEINSTTTEV